MEQRDRQHIQTEYNMDHQHTETKNKPPNKQKQKQTQQKTPQEKDKIEKMNEDETIFADDSTLFLPNAHNPEQILQKNATMNI